MAFIDIPANASQTVDRAYPVGNSPGDDGRGRLHTKISNGYYERIPVSTGAEDTFGRIKVAPPFLLFDTSFQYTLQSQVFVSQLISGATITHDANKAAAILNCTSTIGSIARFRTRNYFPYSPAFTNSLFATFNMKGHTAGVSKRIGQFDEKNGYFLRSFNNTFQVGIRSTISSSTVDTLVDQANWNIDKMDGTGPSKIVLDPTKQQIVYLQYQWLGSGSIFWYFVVNGIAIPVHQFNNANLISTLYSQTATLPIQVEIENVSSTTATTMEFTCCSLSTNGGISQHGHLNSVSSGTTPKTLPTAGISRPILCLRKRNGFSHIPVQILNANVFCTTSDDFLIQIIHNPTLTGASWVTIPNSFCEKDVSATAWTGGNILAEVYLKGNLQASAPIQQIADFWDLTLGDDFANISDIIAIVATPLTTNATAYGVMSFKEFE